MPRLTRISALSAVLAFVLLAAAPAALAQYRHIYPEPTAARADIDEALRTAAREHKRVILDFGGDWCGDCQVLDLYFHNEQNLPLLNAGFVLVHVNIGHMDTNVDIADKYGVPLKKGVPGLSVLNPDGKVVYSQRNGEFEAMRHMDPASVTEFLNRWKPGK